MRLDKFLSNATDFSRKDIKRLVRQGCIEINGSQATDPATQIGADDDVRCDGVVIAAPRPRYFMLHKPAGYVSVTKDSDHPTVLDLLDEPRSETLQIAGRLDLDTTGLLLITDDGAWNHRVTSPRSHCRKTYRAQLARDINPAVAERFAQGVWLDGEKRRTLPAVLRILGPRDVELDICEGKYHQVKRMFAAVDNRVTALHRIAIGHLQLDAGLPPGSYRRLTPDEVAGFEETLVDRELSASEEPSADKESPASKEPSADQEPSANKVSAPTEAPAIYQPLAPGKPSLSLETSAANTITDRTPRKRPRA